MFSWHAQEQLHFQNIAQLETPESPQLLQEKYNYGIRTPLSACMCGNVLSIDTIAL